MRINIRNFFIPILQTTSLEQIMQTQSESPPAPAHDTLQDAGQGLNDDIEIPEIIEIESVIVVSEPIQSVPVTSRQKTSTKTYCKCTREMKVTYLIIFASKCKHRPYITIPIILKSQNFIKRGMLCDLAE